MYFRTCRGSIELHCFRNPALAGASDACCGRSLYTLFSSGLFARGALYLTLGTGFSERIARNAMNVPPRLPSCSSGLRWASDAYDGKRAPFLLLRLSYVVLYLSFVGFVVSRRCSFRVWRCFRLVGQERDILADRRSYYQSLKPKLAVSENLHNQPPQAIPFKILVGIPILLRRTSNSGEKQGM